MTLSGLICGTSALPREEEDCEHERKTRSADSSPRKSRPKSGHGHGHGHNNPYSDRGLDRFSALLSEIEEKRQKIYSQVDDPNEISLVRFVYKAEDHEFKPIIVKAKPPITEQQQQPSKKQPQKTVPSRKFSSFSSSLSPSMATKEVKPEITTTTTTTTKNTKVKWEYYYYPKIYLTMIVIMIMVFLLIFDKSFAIMCTSIGWYVIPHAMSTTTNSSRSLKPNTSKSKEFVRAKLNVEKKQNKVVVLEGTKSFKHPRERVFGCQRTT